MNPNDSAAGNDAEARLAELEKSLPTFDPSGGLAQADKPSATKAGERAPGADNPKGSAGTSQSQASTPSEAEKAEQVEIDSAKAEAEKAGEELKLDDKGKPARGADGKFIKQAKAAKQPDPTKPADDKGSKYAKDKQRRDDSWKALNGEKEAFEAEKTKQGDQLKAERARFEAEKAAYNAERDKERGSQTPEAYEKWSAAEKAKAAELDRQAKEAEAAGEFDKVDQLRELAATARGFEKLARQKAEDLRRNPPPTDKQRQEKQQADMKEWTLKSATDFPEFGKKDSAVQKSAVDFMKTTVSQFRKFATIPELVYFAAQYATAKTAADRVPDLEKELAGLKTKVTELEALTNPTPDGGAARLPGDKSWNELSPDEQYAQLRREAETRG